jgi:3-oxoadipate enol-lactonase
MINCELECGNVHFHDVGQGESLLLVHGFPLDHSMWRHQLNSLSQHFRLIVPDLAGFGRSVRYTEIESTQTFAEDLIELLDYLDLARVHFCGLSMGGYIGWQFWKHHSDRLDRLIACNTRAAADSETVARGRRVTAQTVRNEGVQKLADEMVKKLFAPANQTQKSGEVSQIHNVILETNPETIVQSLLAMAARPDATPWLEQIEHPVLFVAGTEDQITPADEMKENAERVKSSQFALLPDSGHLSPLENPDAFNEAILSFLNK